MRRSTPRPCSSLHGPRRSSATLAVGEDGRRCSGLKLAPASPATRYAGKRRSRRFQLDVRGKVRSHRWSAAFRPSRVAFVTLIRLCRRQRAMLAVWQDDGRAGAAANELPRIPLKIDGRGALTGRARTGGAIILAVQGDAETLLFMGGRGGLLFLLGERELRSPDSPGRSTGAPARMRS